MKEESVEIDETFTLRFEDSIEVKPTKRIKQEEKNSEPIGLNKVTSDAATQTEPFEDLKKQNDYLSHILAFMINENNALKESNAKMIDNQSELERLRKFATDRTTENIVLKCQIKQLESEASKNINPHPAGQKNMQEEQFGYPDSLRPWPSTLSRHY